LSRDDRHDDGNLRAALAQLATVIVVFLAIGIGLLVYAVLRPQPHYSPAKVDQNVHVQVTCPGSGDWVPIVNGKG
jgi:hypothetical protein